MSLLCHAIRENDLELLRKLITGRVRVVDEEDSLHLASNLGRVECVALLLEAKGSINSASHTFHRRTPLHEAALEGRLDCLKVCGQETN